MCCIATLQRSDMRTHANTRVPALNFIGLKGLDNKDQAMRHFNQRPYLNSRFVMKMHGPSVGDIVIGLEILLPDGKWRECAILTLEA